jgi:hypothetical protein
LGLGLGKPGTDTFLDHGALKLGEDPHHLEHRRHPCAPGTRPIFAVRNRRGHAIVAET